MNDIDHHKEAYDTGREIGALTEAVRTLQARFGDFERHVSKRCTDCTMNETMKLIRTGMVDHENRIRWIERKMYGAIAATGLIVWALNKVPFLP